MSLSGSSSWAPPIDEQLLVDGAEDHARRDRLAGAVGRAHRDRHLVARAVARLVRRQLDVDAAVLGAEPGGVVGRGVRAPGEPDGRHEDVGDRPGLRRRRRTGANAGRPRRAARAGSGVKRYRLAGVRRVRRVAQGQVDRAADAVPVGRLDARRHQLRRSRDPSYAGAATSLAYVSAAPCGRRGIGDAERHACSRGGRSRPGPMPRTVPWRPSGPGPIRRCAAASCTRRPARSASR